MSPTVTDWRFLRAHVTDMAPGLKKWDAGKHVVMVAVMTADVVVVKMMDVKVDT